MAAPTILEEYIVKLTVQGPDSGQLRDAEAGLESLRLGIEALLPGLTAAAAGAIAIVKTFADRLTETFYAAQKLGSTTEHVTALGDAAERAGGSIEGIRADLDSLVAKMRGSPAFKDWLKTNLKLSAADMATPESILVVSSKKLAEMRQTDPQHYKALRDYIGTSEATILATARPEFDAAYKQQKEFVVGLDAIAKKSVELTRDWTAATTLFKEALELISGPFMTAMDDAIKRADVWLTEKIPAIEASANSTATTIAGIATKLESIPFGSIADELFDGMQKGLAKINFENIKTVFHEFMNWLVTGPLANAIIELVRRVGAATSGFLDAIMPGMGPVQAPGAPGSQGRFGHGPSRQDQPALPSSGGRFSHGSSNVGRAMNQGSPGAAGAAVDIAETYTGKTISDDDVQTFLRTGGHPDPEKDAWCAAFVGAALHKAGVRDIPATQGGNIASSYARWGQHVDPQDVRRGDVVVLTRGHRPGQTGGHVGLATGPMVDGRIPTIEGNARHMVRQTFERIRPGVLIRRANPPGKNEHESFLAGAHAAMAAIVAHPHAQRQLAICLSKTSRMAVRGRLSPATTACGIRASILKLHPPTRIARPRKLQGKWWGFRVA